MVGALAIDIVAYTYDNLDRNKTIGYNDVEVVINYTYDAWGKLLGVTDANGSVITNTNHFAYLNPIRYRGYFYDTETKLYYCNSRYYDPQVRRFINADDEAVLFATPGEFTDKNLFAYCDNNPVMRGDNGGEFWHVAIGGVKKAGTYLWKMTATYSKQFVGKTIWGIAKSTADAHSTNAIVDRFASAVDSRRQRY